jgi:hypothetical protein
MAKVAMPISIDIVDGSGEILHTSQLSLNPNPDDSILAQHPMTEVFTHDSAADTSEWMIRVRGDGARAIHDVRYDSYWAGEFTIPFDEALRRQ